MFSINKSNSTRNIIIWCMTLTPMPHSPWIINIASQHATPNLMPFWDPISMMRVMARMRTQSAGTRAASMVVIPHIHGWKVFTTHLDMWEHLGNTTIVQWWEIHSAWYPVWGFLAWDFFPIMASSILSEHAFSSAGITITKCCNHLKANVVEALQFLRCSTRSSVLVWDSEDALLTPEVHDKQDSGNDDGETENEWDGSINE